MSIAIERLKRAIADLPKGGMQTGDHKVKLSLADAQRAIAEIEGLKSELVKLGRDYNVARCKFDSLSESIDIVKAERDALAAQNEMLQSELRYFIDGDFEFNEGSEHLADYIVEVLAKTPQQCLAEIRAEAIASLRFPTMLRKMWAGGEIQEWLKEQAAKLRQGDE